jgi:hypothetical protein
MNNKISAVLRIHLKDKATLLYLPIIIFLGNLLISSFFNIFRDQPSMKNSIVTIYVFMFVMGILIIGRTFYFAIGLSTRRRDYMIATMITLIGISAILSLFFSFISLLENYFSFNLGVMINEYSDLNNYPIWEKFYFNFCVFLHMFLLGMLINCLIRVFGKHLIWVLGLLVLGFANLEPLENLAVAFVKILWELPPAAFFNWSLLASFLYGWIIYMILRRLPV